MLKQSACGMLCILLGFVGFPSSQPSDPNSSHDWPQFGFDSRHSGNNVKESILGTRNVSALRLLYQVRLPSVADGAPALISGVQTSSGKRDILFATTKNGDLVALDANTGTVLWVSRHGPGNCRINNGSEPCYTTSSPAIDPDRTFVYTYGLDGYVHKHRVQDGLEIEGSGWPALATLKPWNEKGSSALAVAVARSGRKYLYAANGGYLGDRGDYQGHVTAVDLASGAQRVFNANCSDKAVHFVQRPGQPDCPAVRSAIWARAGVVYDGSTDRIYMATGNGPFDPPRFDWGDSVLALSPDGTGSDGLPLDSYTPSNHRSLDRRDLDLGSTAPAIFSVDTGGRTRHLAVQSGKDSRLHLLDLENLSGRGGPGHAGGAISTIDVPQGGMVFTAPAVWRNPAKNETWVFVANQRGISALAVEPREVLRLSERWRSNSSCTSPVIANDVLYCAGPGVIRALDPGTGRELWHSTQIGDIHWESPIVANGRLYIMDESAHLTAYEASGKG